MADESVVKFHGKSKVEKYLLVLSNMVGNPIFFNCLCTYTFFYVKVVYKNAQMVNTAQ